MGRPKMVLPLFLQLPSKAPSLKSEPRKESAALNPVDLLSSKERDFLRAQASGRTLREHPGKPALFPHNEGILKLLGE
jgi:hypothetical protein